MPATESVDAQRYSHWAIALHWMLAALVLCVGILGLLHDTWPRRSQGFWINMHVLGGLLLWVLLLFRFRLRLLQPPPGLPPDFSVSTKLMALGVHRLLYFLLFVTPLIGIVAFIWHGRLLNLGFYQVDFGVPKDRSIFEPAEDIHGYLAYAIFALTALHVLAAVWHHFIKRDAVLRRMWWRA